ncbi:hypothetical protein UU9_07176 [Rhodanobacter fulvus Jip2]|jgi:uncharacterized membrane protein (UPF0127 family)|uniref:DUF192 domain-containing protein n=1 Tax=Rhodanobacter fulvus Jip2 TaxID=1163408 RepID=I4VRY7_9GAMM|nr:DUF192 domain-containing protein [Rhodanobacter fulvus]EIL89978.1 hypothetical protein UU9_07176 [Rhodanobacter fulvus Jip2]
MKTWFFAVLVLLAGCANAASSVHTSVTVALHGQRFSVELATDNAQRQRGLMMRQSLPADRGMLFVFPRTEPQAFWMKNTLIPLDMLYFDAARQLVSMQLNVPPCRADPCPVYPSEGPARYVLELSGGTARRIGAQPGDELKIEGEIGPVR